MHYCVDPQSCQVTEVHMTLNILFKSNMSSIYTTDIFFSTNQFNIPYNILHLIIFRFSELEWRVQFTALLEIQRNTWAYI